MEGRLVMFLCPGCDERRERKKGEFQINLEPKSGTWYLLCTNCGYTGKYDESILARPLPYDKLSVIGSRELMARRRRRIERRKQLALEQQLKEIEDARRRDNGPGNSMLGPVSLSVAKATRL